MTRRGMDLRTDIRHFTTPIKRLTFSQGTTRLGSVVLGRQTESRGIMMKSGLTALLVMAFAGAASAADIYHGWARGNGDLYPNSIEGYGKEGTGRVGMQPGVGDVAMDRGFLGRGSAIYRQPEPFDHYHGWANGNGDLYPDATAGAGREGTRRVGMQAGVGDVGPGSRLGTYGSSAREDKPFKPTIETFGR